MKKYTILVFLLAFALRASAQLFGGSDAPDFTATDLTGKTWRLYDVLEAGKSVVLVFGVTHSTQVWAYYKSFSMQNFYKASGPAGKNTAELFFIESDPKTNTPCLFGPSGCNGSSLGNWVRDANQYPIFNDDHIPQIYSVKIFPTIVVICPNRKAYDIGIGNEDLLHEKTRECPVAKGEYNIGLFNVQTGFTNQEICEGARVAPSCSIVNLGRQPLDNVRADLLWNGQIVRTERSYNLLPRYGEARIVFDSVPVYGNGNLTIETSIPEALDEHAADNRSTQRFLPAPNTLGNKLILRIRTDEVGSETYWELRDDQNKVVNFGGNRAVGPNGGGKSPNGAPRHPSAYRSNMLVTDTLTLPRPGCYTLVFVDAFGDGLCCSNNTEGYFRVFDPLNITATTPLISGGAFKSYDFRSFYWGDRSTSVLSTDDAWSQSLQLSPNPAYADFNLSMELPQSAPVSVRIVNITGQLMTQMPTAQRPAGAFQETFDTANWPAGLYFCQIRVGKTLISRKIMVAR